MKLALKIAFRFIKSNKTQTILITIGIAIGVSVQLFIGSLIQGLQTSLVEKTIGHSSQITIKPKEENILIDSWESIISAIKKGEPDIASISPSATAPAFLYYGNISSPIILRGFNFGSANKIYDFSNQLTKGKLPQVKNEILIGKDLATKMKINLGDTIKLKNDKGIEDNFIISGFYDLKVVDINKSWIISDLSSAQKFFSMDNKITSIEMQTSKGNEFNADKISTGLDKYISKKSLTVENWKAQNEQLLSGLNGQSVSSYMIQTFVLISVLLGIASVLAISVVQRSKQIGILKAMGIKNSSASLIFLFQGLILGTFGAILGILLGLGLSLSFTKFALNSDGTAIVPLYINVKFIMLSGFLAIFSSIIASLIPARSSSKLDPMEVIKNG